ncbi:MAG TPA: hypothetical protein DHW82_09495 [Spirochaetia bacterium]|nr:MAG: hypothetical protein A2Y41_05415 [Spirochaetes bacterium GWB1_36_13]HCL57224.1 hypothetical protein [Spirochaetia bacterium]
MIEILRQSGIVGYFLLFLAVLTLAIILYKSYSLRHFIQFHKKTLVLRIREKLKEKNISIHSENFSLFIQTELSSEKKKFQKYLLILANISSISPLLGLLGTLIGMIGSTEGILAMDNTALLQGISKALFTTVEGIIVAVPAIISYNYYIGKIEDLEKDLEQEIIQDPD